MRKRSQQDLDVFTQGWSHLLAQALARKGCAMVAFMWRDGDWKIAHVAVQDPHDPMYILDIFGKSRVADAILRCHDSQDIDVVSVDQPWIDRQVDEGNLPIDDPLFALVAEEIATTIFEGLVDPFVNPPVVSPTGLVHFGDINAGDPDGWQEAPLTVTSDPDAWKAAYGHSGLDEWQIAKQLLPALFVDLAMLRAKADSPALLRTLMREGLVALDLDLEPSDPTSPRGPSTGEDWTDTTLDGAAQSGACSFADETCFPTQQLTGAWNLWFGGDLPAGRVVDFAITVLVQRTIPWVDGVWLSSEPAPGRPSVPRGLIFPSRLTEWAGTFEGLSVHFHAGGPTFRRVKIAPRTLRGR